MPEDYTYGFGTDLAPSDSALAGSVDLSGRNEPRSALSEVKCRLESAKFEGGLTWTLGRVRHRRLAPMPPAESQVDNEPGSSAATRTAKEPKPKDLSGVGVTAANAWNDTVNGNLFVRVALDLRSSIAETIITAANIILTMKLADGTNQMFTAMSNAAPTYQKLDPLGQNSTTKTAFEVDPAEDLGKLEQVKLTAGSSSRIVATFAIGNSSIADPKDNRGVAFNG